MSTVEKPKTQREMLAQVWWILIGSNGDGMVSQVKAIKTQTDSMSSRFPMLATKEEVADAITAHECRDDERRAKEEEEKGKKSMTLRDWLQTIGTVGQFLWPILVAIYIFASK